MIECDRDRVQVIGEQVGIDVKGHGGGLVAQHALALALPPALSASDATE